jgi:ABC-type lipopolysaccharide export system ATPase subunit
VALSGGERRRVEIARALASEPSFMLLDEPFAGIDPLAISDIREVVSYLKNRGIGILITDHNVRETLQMVDRASIIHAGEVLFEGSPQEIVDNPEVRRVYLGDQLRRTLRQNPRPKFLIRRRPAPGRIQRPARLVHRARGPFRGRSACS